MNFYLKIYVASQHRITVIPYLVFAKYLPILTKAEFCFFNDGVLFYDSHTTVGLFTNPQPKIHQIGMSFVKTLDEIILRAELICLAKVGYMNSSSGYGK